MPANPITLGDCTPYLSTVIMKGNLSTATEICKSLRPLIKNEYRNLKKQPAGVNAENDAIHYTEQKPASWYQPNNPADILKNTNHHAVFISVKDNILALTFTDSPTRNSVMRQVKSSTNKKLSSLQPLTLKEMEMIFVNDEIRTLWLSGAHSRSIIKPDSKVLSGQQLESALSPIGDQTYFFSSIRSTLGEGADKFVLGASPAQSRVWQGPSKSWEGFESRIDEILSLTKAFLEDPKQYSARVPVLAQNSDNLDDIGTPYDFALIVPENLSPDIEEDAESSWFQIFAEAAVFDISINDGNNTKFTAKVSYREEELGTIDYELEKTTSGKIRLKSEVKDWKGGDQNDVFKMFLTNSDFVTVYFDSGHSFSRNRLIETRFRDQPFESWEWASFPQDIETPTDVTKEKPGKGSSFPIDEIGADDDTSLFTYLVKNHDSIQDLIPRTGWLICDDGSMESADFIHFDVSQNPNVLTLIHVKGSKSDKSNRGVSTGDYEVVVGQAVKNLRNMERRILLDKLDKEKGKKIGTAVWLDSEYHGNRDGFLTAFNAATDRLDKRVIVFQPGVKKSILDSLRANPNNTQKYKRLQQLDALLLSAQSSCYELGAEFIVLADGS